MHDLKPFHGSRVFSKMLRFIPAEKIFHQKYKAKKKKNCSYCLFPFTVIARNGKTRRKSLQKTQKARNCTIQLFNLSASKIFPKIIHLLKDPIILLAEYIYIYCVHISRICAPLRQSKEIGRQRFDMMDFNRVYIIKEIVRFYLVKSSDCVFSAL